MLSWGTAFGLPGSSAETSLQDQRCAVRCEAARSSAFAFCREFRAVCDQSLQILQSVSPSGASGSSGVGGARQDGQDDQDWLHPPHVVRGASGLASLQNQDCKIGYNLGRISALVSQHTALGFGSGWPVVPHVCAATDAVSRTCPHL